VILNIVNILFYKASVTLAEAFFLIIILKKLKI